jgi:hypothetical protein
LNCISAIYQPTKHKQTTPHTPKKEKTKHSRKDESHWTSHRGANNNLAHFDNHQQNQTICALHHSKIEVFHTTPHAYKTSHNSTRQKSNMLSCVSKLRKLDETGIHSTQLLLCSQATAFHFWTCRTPELPLYMVLKCGLLINRSLLCLNECSALPLIHPSRAGKSTAQQLATAQHNNRPLSSYSASTPS